MNMKEISVVFPHQLFDPHPALLKTRPVYLVEDALFFQQYRFHLQKLFYHRATLHAYKLKLEQKGFTVSHFKNRDEPDLLEQVFEQLRKKKTTAVHLADPVDYLLKRRIERLARIHSVKAIYYPSPNFINTQDALDEYFKGKKRYFQIGRAHV